MNYANDILDSLTQEMVACEIILAPGSPPIQRLETGLETVGTGIFKAADIRDTLQAFAELSKAGGGPLPKSGVFSFGSAERGRFRVAYMTQRGSYLVSITKVPLEVPMLSELLDDPGIAKKAEALFQGYNRGLLVVTGPSSLLTNTVVYSLIRGINETQPRLVLILERAASYLLKHDRALVLQCEVGTDAENLEAAVRDSLQVNPDILYVRDICSREEFQQVQKAAEGRVLMVVSMSVMDIDKWLVRSQFTRENLIGNSQQACGALGVWQVYPSATPERATMRLG